MKYADAEKTSIEVSIGNGKFKFVPVAPGNTDYDKIVEDGTTIDDYVAPAETMESIRGKRNQLLKDTDWHGMSDVTMSDEMAAYRILLRNLPSTNSDPTKIKWPTAPA